MYDPLGRRIGKQVWKREREHPDHEQMALSRRPYTTWYGWEGDRLATIRTQKTKIQTIYGPGSFTPLIRIETDNAELEKAAHRTLAETLQQDGSEDGGDVVFPAELVRMLDRLEGEIRRNQITEESREWLAGCGLTVEQMAAQMEEACEPERQIHLYHCDHRGLPLALVSPDNSIAWRGEYDEWGNLLNEESLHNTEQLIRLPGQQYDEESGLYYNRHRYYSPEQGRYITQDLIGLWGGWNLYQYPLNPVEYSDPLGLDACKVLYPDYPIEYADGWTSTWLGGHGGIVGYDKKGVTKYYEYGRYAPGLKGIVGVKRSADYGNIRNLSMPNLVLDKDGNPTKKSLENLKSALSKRAGKNTAAELTCSKDVDEKKIYDYINGIANNEKRDKYAWNPFSPNQCRSFADDAFNAGGG